LGFLDFGFWIGRLGQQGLLPSAYWLLLTAFCPIALCLLPSAFCLPREGAGGGVMLRILPFVRQLRDEILAKTRQMANGKDQISKIQIKNLAVCHLSVS
jgi:hypothetical protein